MNRPVARALHAATNISFWMENTNWSSGDPTFDIVCKGLRALPFSVHEAQKRVFFDNSRLIAVNGETVVVANGTDKVDKFMFRYPGKTDLEDFRDRVTLETRAVNECLAGVALATEVSIKPADIIKYTRKPVLAVVQTQHRLDLEEHDVLDLPALESEPPTASLDRTARDLETVVRGSDKLIERHGYYPDVAFNSGNLRRSILDGAVTLLDVMPFYADGNRLIDDNPPNVVPHLLDSLKNYSQFVGQYGG